MRSREYVLSYAGRAVASVLLPALLGTGCGIDPSPRPAAQSAEFEKGPTAGALTAGWSGFESTPDGTTFAWAEGTEASLRFGPSPRGPRLVRIRAWAFGFPGAEPQLLSVLVNDCRVGRIVLPSEPSEHVLPTPWSVWKEEGNVLRFRFSRADAPRDRLPGATDGRLLAAAFDRVRIEPPQPVTD